MMSVRVMVMFRVRVRVLSWNKLMLIVAFTVKRHVEVMLVVISRGKTT